MIQKALGVLTIAFCLVMGCFIAVMSLVARIDGETDSILFHYFHLGVTLVVIGFLVLQTITRRRRKRKRGVISRLFSP
jgi:uncharacterized membrane protein